MNDCHSDIHTCTCFICLDFKKIRRHCKRNVKGSKYKNSQGTVYENMTETY